MSKEDYRLFDEFEELTGIDLLNYNDNRLTMLTGRYSLHITKLDDTLHRTYDYTEEEHGSMKDFITTKWSKRAAEIISELLGSTK